MTNKEIRKIMLLNGWSVPEAFLSKEEKLELWTNEIKKEGELVKQISSLNIPYNFTVHRELIKINIDKINKL